MTIKCLQAISSRSIWASRSRQTRLQTVAITYRSLATRSEVQNDHNPRLPSSPVRTRFAPSPTGNLHLGSIRTALYNYLLAKRTKGEFLLRIEDTDQKRTVSGSEQRLYSDLKWAGLEWDEGPDIGGLYGPYRQSERLEIYQQHIQTLLNAGKAYRCFCTADRLDQLNQRRHEKGLPLGYDRKCHHVTTEQAGERASKGESHVIRFIAPEKYPRYEDLVYGKSGHGVKRKAEEEVFDDPILMKSDGFPTYHFANIVDDHLMKISHVVRGSEWMASTPLHVALYEAFGWQPPAFAHVPLLVDHNKQKLSKRNFDSDISSYRDKGVLPEPLNNFAVLLGWSHQGKSDHMTLPELESVFDLKITKGNVMVNPAKLKYLQDKHFNRMAKDPKNNSKLEKLIPGIIEQMSKQYGEDAIKKFAGNRSLEDVLKQTLHVESFCYRNAEQYAQQLEVLIKEPPKHTEESLANFSMDHNKLSMARTTAATLLAIPENQWNRHTLRQQIKEIQFPQGPHPKYGQSDIPARREFHSFLRWALTGGGPSPDNLAVMELLGHEVAQNRLLSAISVAKQLETRSTQPKIDVQKL